MVHTCGLIYWFKASLSKISARTFLKSKLKAKGRDSRDRVHEALSPIPNAVKKRKKRKIVAGVLIFKIQGHCCN
jgi:hypothetical protein